MRFCLDRPRRCKSPHRSVPCHSTQNRIQILVRLVTYSCTRRCYAVSAFNVHVQSLTMSLHTSWEGVLGCLRNREDQLLVDCRKQKNNGLHRMVIGKRRQQHQLRRLAESLRSHCICMLAQGAGNPITMKRPKKNASSVASNLYAVSRSSLKNLEGLVNKSRVLAF